MQQARTITIPIVAGVAAIFGSAIVLFLFYFVLGLLTGVFGMCAIAPEWWQGIYFKLFFAIPIIAVVIGVFNGRRIYENQKFQDIQLN